MTRLIGACALLLAVLPLVVGCGGSSSTMKAIDEPTIAYAKSVRSQIEGLKKADDFPAMLGNIDSFAENMASYKTAAVGEHEATYAKIAAISQEMQAMKQRNAKPNEFQPKLDELETLASTLPGGTAPTSSAN